MSVGTVKSAVVKIKYDDDRMMTRLASAVSSAGAGAVASSYKLWQSKLLLALAVIGHDDHHRYFPKKMIISTLTDRRLTCMPS